jgi:hypothetical protein
MARVLQFSWFKWAKRLPVRGASARGAPVPAYRPPVLGSRFHHWGIAAGDASSEAHRDAQCVAGGNPASGALLGARATHESEGTVIRQLRFMLCICGGDTPNNIIDETSY